MQLTVTHLQLCRHDELRCRRQTRACVDCRVQVLLESLEYWPARRWDHTICQRTARRFDRHPDRPSDGHVQHNVPVSLVSLCVQTRRCSGSANLRQGVQPQTKVIWDSNPDFRINQDSNPNVCRIAAKMLRISTPCRHESFCQESWKTAGDCIRNANKSPKIPYSVMVREVENWYRIRIRNRITTKKFNQFFRSVGPIIISRFRWNFKLGVMTGPTNHNNHQVQRNRLITSAVILQTDILNDKLTDLVT